MGGVGWHSGCELVCSQWSLQLRQRASVPHQQAPSVPPPASPSHRALCLCLNFAMHDGSAPPSADYLEVMKDKGLVLRTDVFEVLLAQLAGGGAGGGDDDGDGDSGGAGNA